MLKKYEADRVRMLKVKKPVEYESRWSTKEWRNTKADAVRKKTEYERLTEYKRLTENERLTAYERSTENERSTEYERLTEYES